jgi:hypothetical protein
MRLIDGMQMNMTKLQQAFQEQPLAQHFLGREYQRCAAFVAGYNQAQADKT